MIPFDSKATGNPAGRWFAASVLVGLWVLVFLFATGSVVGVFLAADIPSHSALDAHRWQVVPAWLLWCLLPVALMKTQWFQSIRAQKREIASWRVGSASLIGLVVGALPVYLFVFFFSALTFEKQYGGIFSAYPDLIGALDDPSLQPEQGLPASNSGLNLSGNSAAACARAVGMLDGYRLALAPSGTATSLYKGVEAFELSSLYRVAWIKGCIEDEQFLSRAHSLFDGVVKTQASQQGWETRVRSWWDPTAMKVSRYENEVLDMLRFTPNVVCESVGFLGVRGLARQEEMDALVTKVRAQCKENMGESRKAELADFDRARLLMADTFKGTRDFHRGLASR